LAQTVRYIVLAVCPANLPHPCVHTIHRQLGIDFDNVTSPADCGALCLKNPKCFASAWNGGSSDHFNQCYLKGNGTAPVASDITTGCACRGPPPPHLPPPPTPFVGRFRVE
jgi:hypothetical protein